WAQAEPPEKHAAKTTAVRVERIGFIIIPRKIIPRKGPAGPSTYGSRTPEPARRKAGAPALHAERDHQQADVDVARADQPIECRLVHRERPEIRRFVEVVLVGARGLAVLREVIRNRDHVREPRRLRRVEGAGLMLADR